MSSMRSHLLAAVSAVAIIAAPLVALPIFDLPDGYTAVAGNGKGSGKKAAHRRGPGLVETSWSIANQRRRRKSCTAANPAEKARQLNAGMGDSDNLTTR